VFGSWNNQSLARCVVRDYGGELMVNCPLCDAAMDVDEEELDEGDSLICEECGASLNVSGTAPLEITPSKDEVDDDEDDDDDLDDDFDEDEDDEDEDEEEDEED
jgi:alpha-aminoadipate carrier protein LysW